MANGGPRACCVLGICCLAGSAEQRQALIDIIKKRHTKLDDERAGKRADHVLKKYDHFRDLAALVDEDAA